MCKRPKILSWLARGAVAALVIYLFFLGCLYVFLQRDPDKLVAEYLQSIAERTGLQFDIGAIDVTLFPLPAMALSDVAVKGAGMDFTASWAQARPTLTNLLHGRIFPGKISIVRPKIIYTSPLPIFSAGTTAIFGQLFTGGGIGKGSLPASLTVELTQAEAIVSGHDAKNLRIANLDATLRLEPDGDISGKLRISAIWLSHGKNNLAALENFRLSGRSNIHNFTADSHDIYASGVATWRGIARNVNFDIRFNSASQGWHGEGSINGGLDVGGEEIPCSLAGKAVSLAAGDEIVFRGGQWQLGADSGRLDLSFSPQKAKSDFVLNGFLLANRLSLTQWLGFARNLAPGLQLALDNIVDAKMRFRIDSKGLSATNISAACCGATFTGSGGVADWQHPVVALDLKSPVASLGLGLPESVGKGPVAPKFDHPPLTPMPGTPLKPEETGIGYDIRLGAGMLRYGPLKIRNASLRIHPGKLDKSGLQDVLLDAAASLYGGKVTGACILGAAKTLPMHITAKAEKVDGLSISRDMPVLPFRKGIWKGNATITSSGKKLDMFLANLRGNISASGANAAFAATGSNIQFKDVSASVRLRSGAWNGKHLTMDGVWDGSIKDEKLSGQSELNGKIQFGEDGVAFRRLPGAINARLSFMPDNNQVKLKGKFGANSARNIFEVEDGVLELLGITVHGSGKLDGAKQQILGKMHTEIPNPQHFLSEAGFKKLKLPKAVSPIHIKADFVAAENNIGFSNIAASLGQTRLSGSVSCSFKNKKPALSLDLVLPRLDLAAFFPSSQTKADPDWDFTFLTALDASGNIKIGDLSGWNAQMQNFQAPFELKEGKLLTNDIKADFYGAILTGSFDADFRHGLVFDSLARAHGFDLGAAAREQKIKSRLGGKADIDMRLNAKLVGKSKLTSALGGRWAFSVKNGFWQGMDKEKPGKITKFNTAEAYGTVNNGIVRSDNFRLIGPGLTVKGKGELNLSAQTMDCDFNVSMKGLPDFPIRLYGKLNNMQTSIGAGKFILNAVGEVTGGFVNAVGGLLKGAWGIFTK